MTRERFHAVFLAAIMVLSVIAMGAGFAGSAAADSSSVVVGPDGDYQSIQTAIDEEGANTTITVQKGSYSSFVITSDNVTVKAAEDETPTVSGASEFPSYPTTVGIDANHTTISGLNIDAGERGIYVVAGSSHVEISQNLIEVSAGDATYGILTGDDQTNLTISNNTFTTPDGEANNHIYVNGDTAGLASSDISVTGNSFEGSVGYAVGVDAASARVTDNNFSAVTILQDRKVAIEVFSDPDPIISGNVGPLVDIVPEEGKSNTDQRYTSVQAAVNSANPGDTVNVAPGTYNESNEGLGSGLGDVGLYLNTPNITIQGVDMNGEPITDRENVATHIISQGSTLANTNGVYVGADNVTITGIKLSPDPDAAPNKNIEVVADGFTIRNAIVGDGDSDGFAGSIYFNTGEVQSFEVTDSDVDGYLSVSNGVGNETSAANRVISDNQIGILQFSGTQADIPWRNYDVGSADVSGNDIADGVYSQGKVELNLTVVAEGNQFLGGKVTARTPKGTIRSANVSVKVGETGWTDKTEVNLTYIQGIYTDITPAVEDAKSGDTVRIEGSTYTENVTVRTANVTLEGENNPVVDGRIDIKSDEVAVRDLTVQNGAPSGDEVEGIFVGNSDGFDDRDGKVTIRNVTVEDIHPHGNSKAVEGIHIKHYDDGENIDGVEIDHVTVRNVTGQSLTGANGVKLQAGVHNVSIEDSTIDSIEGNWAYGLTPTLSSDQSGTPTDVEITQTTFSNVSGPFSSGLWMGSDDIQADDPDFADPTEISVEQNEFIHNDGYDIGNADSSRTLEAPLNYYGESGTPNVLGNVIYDPLLTTSIDQVNTEERGEIRNYGSYIELNSSGDAVAVGFSAAPDGNASKIFSDLDIEGNAFTYDNDDGYVEVEPDDTFSAGDVVVVTNNGVDEDMIVPIDTSVESEAAQPTSVEVENGWNLVATGAANDVSGITAALGGTGSIADSAVLQTQAKQPGAPPARFGAYGGTWIFVDGSGEISTGYAEDQSPTEYYTELLLTDQTRIDSDDEDGDS